MASGSNDPLNMTDAEIKRRRRGRNLAVAGLLLAFVAIVYFVTIARIQTGIEASQTQ